jgi:imidazolonepropionase-like amidohydrolase
MRLPATVSVAATLLTLTALHAAPPPPFAIKDARIVTAPGKTLEHATIVFRDGRIEAVGTTAAVPPDALVEDGRNLTVYPGFIDLGSSFPLEPSSPEAARAKEGAQPNLQVDPPITTPEARRKGIRAALDLAASALLEGDHRVQERRAGFTVALAVPPQGFLSGRSAVFALGDGPRRSSVLEARTFLHAGFHSPEGEHWGYPHTLMGAHAHIRQAFLDAQRKRELEQRSARGAPGPRPAFDLDLDALLPALDRKIRVAWAADTVEDVARVLALSHELGLEIAITDARHAAKAAPTLRREGIPVIVSLAWGPKPKAAIRELDPAPRKRKGHDDRPFEGPFYFCALPPVPIGPASGPPYDPTEEPEAIFHERERRHAEEIANLRDLFMAGVRVGVSSQGLHGAGEVREHLREAIQAGLPEEAALGALTRDAAAIVGLGDRLGTLAPGKLAFATVLTGNLGDEKARVKFTVIDGERVEGETPEEDARLARLAGRYRVDAGSARGTLVLEAASGKLTGRIALEGGSETALTATKLEGDRLKLTVPKGALPSEKGEVKVDARWVAADVLEGTAEFADGPRPFRATREVP